MNWLRTRWWMEPPNSFRDGMIKGYIRATVIGYLILGPILLYLKVIR